MSTIQQKKDKVRLTIECSLEERKFIKILAARKDKSMNEFVMGCIRKEMPRCTLSHKPNKETAQVLRDTDEGKNLIEYETLDEFWEDLGFNKHA